jgi:hypothetical protein
MNLKIFYHTVNLPENDSLLQERFAKFKKSGLIDVAEIYLCAPDDIDLSNYKSNNVTIVHHGGNLTDCEHPTLGVMHRIATETTEPFYSLYLHQKGITAIGSPSAQKMDDWRNLMDYWCIEQWRNCIDKLNEGFNIVGCNYNLGPVKHFSGNQYWATSEFIKTWPKLELPSNVSFAPQIDTVYNSYRHDAEFLYGRLPNIVPYTMFNSNVDHYHTEFPESLYRA